MIKTFLFSTLLFCLLGAQTASAGYIYQIDDGGRENSLGLTGGGTMAWGNQYNVVSGAEWITHLHIHFYASSFLGSPFTGAIYSDPDLNGTAVDAVLLGSLNGVAAAEGWNIYAFNAPVYAGAAGASFFAVATALHAPGQHPADFDQSSDALRSWVSFSADFTQAMSISSVGYPGNFMIRAQSGEATGGEIPEPGTAALLAGALLVLGALARRR